MSDQSPFGRLTGPVFVSACLLGLRCRYDGTSRPCRAVLDIPCITVIPVCPEQLGGLPTPRPSAGFAGGDGDAVLGGTARIVDAQGRDVTPSFVLGAGQVCMLAENLHVRHAILKERSPSCGTHLVWQDGALCPGRGVTAAMLVRLGIDIMNEEGHR